MDDRLELRTASYDHPDAVELTERAQQYYIEIYGGRDDDPLSAELLAPPHGGFLLGYLGGDAVAMGGWYRSSTDPTTAHLRRMYVDSAARRHGVGRSLLAGLEADAAGHGVSQLILTTGTPQVAAIALYRSAGYVDIEPFGYYADSGTAVHLGKSIGAEVH